MKRGRLRVLLGAAPGVGKTYEMLEEGRRLLAEGRDVVIAIVETHGRAATAAFSSTWATAFIPTKYSTLSIQLHKACQGLRICLLLVAVGMIENI